MLVQGYAYAKGKYQNYRLWQSIRAAVRRNKFWFVDVPRTSSSSLRSEISKEKGNIYGKQNLLDGSLAVSMGIPDHLPAQDARKLLGPTLWGEAFTFSVVRNPWDRFLSLYHYGIISHTFPATLTFREFVSQLESPRYKLQQRLHRATPYYFSACDYLEDENGNLMVDYVARYESRKRDIKTIGQHIGIEDFGSVVTQEAAPDAHYSTFYDAYSRDVVGKNFKDDIERFGYSF